MRPIASELNDVYPTPARDLAAPNRRERRQYRRFLLRVSKATRDRHMAEELANVDVPTLIVWGRNDTITPPFVAEQFRDSISRAELAFIDQCGHSPPIEQPEEFARLLHTFLDGLPSS